MVRALLAAVVVMAITAVGDTVSIATASSSNIQPPSGEVWDITAFKSDKYDFGLQLSLYDGTDDTVANATGSLTATNAETTAPLPLKVVLSNTQYARMWNKLGTTQVLGYRGVKLAP